jgi:hypothetical protein
MNRFLFFDVITINPSIKTPALTAEAGLSSRLLQLAFLLYNESEELLSSGNFIIRPAGFEFLKKSQPLIGFTHQYALDNGQPLYKAMCAFSCAVINSDYIVAHNMDFAYSVVISEAHRLGIEKQFNAMFEFRQRICMKELPSELYKKSNLIVSDNALSTAKACAKCFFELKRQGVYNINCLA